MIPPIQAGQVPTDASEVQIVRHLWITVRSTLRQLRANGSASPIYNRITWMEKDLKRALDDLEDTHDG